MVALLLVSKSHFILSCSLIVAHGFGELANAPEDALGPFHAVLPKAPRTCGRLDGLFPAGMKGKNKATSILLAGDKKAMNKNKNT